ncbi:MAG: BMP family ABC transporter substrate-binding protein [Candidatus Thorarchaeota archaeon]|nr:MAG: BMP family ABC transporter substrate-binding protein [Candidatus Thorarchaeota archaeon]
MEQRTTAIILIVIIVVGVGAVVFLGPSLFPAPPRVALILGTGGRGDLSFNDASYAGAMNARNELGWNFDVAEPDQIAEFEGLLRDYAAAGTYDVIISGSFDQADALALVAADFPNQTFAIVDNVVVAPNVRSCVFTENEGSALVGALAGLMTQTGHVGFVGGEDMWLIHRFAAGYVWGANYTNPGVNFTVQYTGSWIDTAIGQNLGDAMFTAGADIIYTAAGRSGLGAWTSARNRITGATNTTPLWMIGVDSPMMWYGCDTYDQGPGYAHTAPTFGLTSMLKRVDSAVFEVIEDVMNGDLDSTTGSIFAYNLENGGHDWEINGYIPYSNVTDVYTLTEYDSPLLTLSQSIVDTIQDLKADIIAGTVTVPDTIYWT